MRSYLALLIAVTAACAEPDDTATTDAPIGIRPITPNEPLVVTLTFDDTHDEQFEMAALLAGLPSTFYVNSARVGQPDTLSHAQLAALAAAGHEIGSHTLSHPHLPALDAAAREAEMCGDRAALNALGHVAPTIAYPFGDDSEAVRATAADCGFEGARDIGGLRNADPWNGGAGYCGTAASSLDRPAAEQLPPLDPFAIRSRASIRTTCTVTDLQDMLLAAAADTRELPLTTRRWVVLTFHDFCAGGACTGATYAWDMARFRTFVGWLRGLGGTIPIRNESGRQIGRRPLVVRTVAGALAPL